MYTFTAVLSVGFGLMCLVVVAVGVYRGYFPFRPRKAWRDPPPGSQNSSPTRVSRLDEPELFWGLVVVLGAFGVAGAAGGVAVAAKLF